MAGLLDAFNSDEGLLGLGLLMAAAPSPQNIGIGARLGTALNWVQNQKDSRMDREAQAMRMDAYRQQQEQAKAAQQRELQFQQALQQGASPSQLANIFPEKIDLLKKLAEAPNFGRQEVARTVDVVGPNNQKMVRQLDRYGNPVAEDVAGYVPPQLVNLGNRQLFATPQAGASYEVGMSPSERDASARGWASNAIARERLAIEKEGLANESGGPGQAMLVKQFGKPAPGYRWKADGSQEFIPGGPADQKAQQQNVGQESVSAVVNDLRDKYAKLQKEGGIVSTGNNALSNAAARLGSSGVGQLVGSAVGTEAQSARDSIEMTRPLLLASIMKATGMSAKQMDSNAELKLWLATATDPTKGLGANLEALNRIEKMYGSGKALQSADQKKPSVISSLPTPNASNRGQRVRDTVTGKILVSNGLQWKEE